MNIAVITPSLPARSKMLGEAIESVKSQSLQPKCHLIAMGLGRSIARNVMADGAFFRLGCNWLAFLDDDDLLLPNHLELLASAVNVDTDLVYSRCQVQVEAGVSHPDVSDWARGWSASDINVANWIPVTVLMRASTFFDLGGFNSTTEPREDWDLWQRLADIDGAVESVDEVTWTYRFHNNGQDRYR